MSEPLPEPLYVYVDGSNPIVHHNVFTMKRLFSPAVLCWEDPEQARRYQANEIDWLPFVPNERVGPDDCANGVSFFALGLTAQYRVEYNAELARRHAYPQSPSRLSAIYAFGDEQSYMRANALYGWPLGSLHRFRLIPHPLTRWTRVNMEIVSLSRRTSTTSYRDPVTEHQVWDAYWSGAGSIDLEIPQRLGGRQVVSSGVIWEYLIDGVLELID